ncbi:polysaccharide biosynthesis tyrosine autokinase [Curtobacterium sp. VKM Ac-1395]|uniref:polysaccharide biosynthesis tyrosine autokinase n=1 Tax=Curtobacterium sp. VKM Ac-1395 TaxID=2783815 RepID=UPI00188C45B0|nr:polysaccharide biosynthesis tyrosine autokinase [Curtobacterium sp. VKM Ac-1395]MBF4589293.1 polysaccharide biosynthesis tyrosine autokinase [Curtobacterium sp. VKM Ac-1395]
MELRDYITVLRKGWALILVLALIGVAAAAGYSLLKKPVYSTSAQVFVSTQTSGSASDLAQGNTFTQQRVLTYSNLVTTPIVLLPVISSLKLDMTTDQLASRVTADAPLNTTLIAITVNDTDPVQAAEIANAASQSLTNVVQNIEATDADGQSTVKLTRVKQADVPSVPVSPNVPVNVVLGLLIGLALGVGLSVLRQALDNRVRTEADVERISAKPIVGGIAFDSKASERPLIVQADPRSPRAESFRTLRTNLQFVDIGSKARTFVMTSSVQSEGKSTTVANLAIALDSAGYRVILIDADLRRPRVAEYMEVETNAGLTDVLIGRAELEDVAHPWGRGNMVVLPAGPIPPNPSELLGSQAMQKLIERLESEFDYVLFDAPPLLPVTDAAILSKKASGAIVVVASGKTLKGQLAGAVQSLENVDAPIAGFVMTMMPTKGPGAYGYGRYGYAYGYGIEEDADRQTASKQPKQPKRGRLKAARGTER